VIISTPKGRFVYCPDQKPYDLATDDNLRLVTCLDNLPYQEGTPLSEEGSDTELVTHSSSGYCSPGREVFVVATEARSSRQNQRFPEDISVDELSADAPADETEEAQTTRRGRNAERVTRRQELADALPIRNLEEALDAVATDLTTLQNK